MRTAVASLLPGFQTLLESDLAKSLMSVLGKTIAPYKFAMQRSLETGELLKVEGDQVILLDPSYHIIKVCLQSGCILGYKIAMALRNWNLGVDLNELKSHFI